MSIVDWIEESIPGGMASQARPAPRRRLHDRVRRRARPSRARSTCSTSSATRARGTFRIFGPSNEKYHVAGGNDQIVTRLADRLPGQIATGIELVAIRKGQSTYTLTFRSGSGTTTVTADRVVLALPFSILRSSVDLSKAGFEPRKLTAIREQGMGTNSKLHVQFSSRFWNGLGSNGETFSDTGYQNTWEVTRGQPGASGILVDYTGGAIGASFGSGTPQTRARKFLAQLEPVLPGATAAWNGKASIDHWTASPWTKGSYSYWKVGPVHELRRLRGGAPGRLPLRRRAHLPGLPGLSERRGRERPARCRGDPGRPEVGRVSRRARPRPRAPGG